MGNREARVIDTDVLRLHENDDGSPPFQIGTLTNEIEKVAFHLKRNPKDKSSRKGLMKKMWKRRKLLEFLRKRDFDSYVNVLTVIGITR
jgi:small subunit ribosomal protein S15